MEKLKDSLAIAILIAFVGGVCSMGLKAYLFVPSARPAILLITAAVFTAFVVSWAFVRVMNRGEFDKTDQD